MVNKFRRLIPIISLVLWDVLCVILSLYIAVKLCHPHSVINMPVFLNLGTYDVFLSIIFVLFNALFGCYSSVLRHIGLKDAIRQFVAVLFSVTGLYLLDLFSVVNIFLPNNTFSYGIEI